MTDDRFSRPSEPAAPQRSRPRCAKCRGAGWVLNDHDDRARRCHCNPGEPVLAWHGGDYGTSSFTPAWDERVRERDQ